MNALAAFVAAVLVATPVQAAGLAVRWASCLNDGGTQNRAFACNTNAGSEDLIGSFILDADIGTVPPDYQSILDVATAGGSLSPWWDDVCRPTSLRIVAMDPPPTSQNCVDPGSGVGAFVVTQFLARTRGPNTMRFVLLGHYSVIPLWVVVSGQEWTVFRFSVKHDKTVGTGACSGCSTPACLVYNSLAIQLADGGAMRLTGPGFGPGSDYALWQGGAGVQVGAAIGCPAATPVRTRTWGEVKSLYR